MSTVVIVDGSWIHSHMLSQSLVLDPMQLVAYIRSLPMIPPIMDNNSYTKKSMFWIEPIPEASKNYRTALKLAGFKLVQAKVRNSTSDSAVVMSIQLMDQMIHRRSTTDVVVFTPSVELNEVFGRIQMKSKRVHLITTDEAVPHLSEHATSCAVLDYDLVKKIVQKNFSPESTPVGKVYQCIQETRGNSENRKLALMPGESVLIESFQDFKIRWYWAVKCDPAAVNLKTGFQAQGGWISEEVFKVSMKYRSVSHLVNHQGEGLLKTPKSTLKESKVYSDVEEVYDVLEGDAEVRDSEPAPSAMQQSTVYQRESSFDQKQADEGKMMIAGVEIDLDEMGRTSAETIPSRQKKSESVSANPRLNNVETLDAPKRALPVTSPMMFDKVVQKAKPPVPKKPSKRRVSVELVDEEEELKVASAKPSSLITARRNMFEKSVSAGPAVGATKTVKSHTSAPSNSRVARISIEEEGSDELVVEVQKSRLSDSGRHLTSGSGRHRRTVTIEDEDEMLSPNSIIVFAKKKSVTKGPPRPAPLSGTQKMKAKALIMEVDDESPVAKPEVKQSPLKITTNSIPVVKKADSKITESLKKGKVMIQSESEEEEVIIQIKPTKTGAKSYSQASASPAQKVVKSSKMEMEEEEELVILTSNNKKPVVVPSRTPAVRSKN